MLLQGHTSRTGRRDREVQVWVQGAGVKGSKRVDKEVSGSKKKVDPKGKGKVRAV